TVARQLRISTGFPVAGARWPKSATGMVSVAGPSRRARADASEDGDGDLDGAADRVRVGAAAIGFRDQLFGNGAVTDRGKGHIERDHQAETTLADGPESHARSHRRIVGDELPTTGDPHHRALVARPIPKREELLGVGARSTVSAQLRRAREVDLDTSIRGRTM